MIANQQHKLFFFISHRLLLRFKELKWQITLWMLVNCWPICWVCWNTSKIILSLQFCLHVSHPCKTSRTLRNTSGRWRQTTTRQQRLWNPKLKTWPNGYNNIQINNRTKAGVATSDTSDINWWTGRECAAWLQERQWRWRSTSLSLNAVQTGITKVYVSSVNRQGSGVGVSMKMEGE